VSEDIGKKIVDLDLKHAETIGKVYGIPVMEFYDALERVFKDAEEFGVDREYVSSRALAVEKRFLRRQIRLLAENAERCLRRGDYKGYAAFMILKNRYEDFRQTQKLTGKTAVELGKEELFRRMFFVAPTEKVLEDETLFYALLLTLFPPLPEEHNL